MFKPLFGENEGFLSSLIYFRSSKSVMVLM